MDESWTCVLVVDTAGTITAEQSQQNYDNSDGQEIPVKEQMIEQIDWDGAYHPGKVLAAISVKQDEVVVVSYDEAQAYPSRV